MTESLIRAPGDHAIEARFPGAYTDIPRVKLTRLPTPVERLRSLEGEVGIESLWVKRDDRVGDLYGGNKPRKLEFLLGEALVEGKRTVLTSGGIGTHHGLATAVCARSLGLRTILVLLKQPVTAAVRRSLLLDFATGADMYYGSSVPRLTVVALRVCARELLHDGLPYIVPTGGTSPLGALGYVNAAFELADQVAGGELPEPAWIFVPLGSGGTVAGLVAGLKLAGLRSRVAAVLVTDILPPSPARLARLANRALRSIGERVAPAASLVVNAEDFVILTGHVGAAYGAPTEEGRRAAELVQRTQGIALETTYTAKCVASLFVEGRQLARDGPILFWNTYSSIDPAPHLGTLPDYHELPTAFHQFFDGPTVEG